jgi:hypothetical protein
VCNGGCLRYLHGDISLRSVADGRHPSSLEMMTSILLRTAYIIGAIVVVISAILNIYLYNYDRIRRCQWEDSSEITVLAFGDPQITGTTNTTSFRKRLDVYGNDRYLGHIFRILTTHLSPSHVAVMGDLISSQWIDDNEFYDRARRFQNNIFVHTPESPFEFINISGNHDIGYVGEMTHERMNRFNNAYGDVNYLKSYSGEHPWRFVVINSLALDGPAHEPQFHDDVTRFLDSIRTTNFNGSTVLFTHIPLFKPEGVCHDGEYFDYYDWGTLKEQNHLSKESSDLILNSVFGPGIPYRGIILAGHDHEGCQTDYRYDQQADQWEAYPASEIDGVREVTVRSMMGEYGGNAGLVSGTWDEHQSHFVFAFSLCTIGVQHIWWTTKVLTILSIPVLLIFGVASGALGMGIAAAAFAATVLI